LICIVSAVAQVKAKLDGAAKQKHLVHSRQQDAVTSILRTADYFWPFLFTGVSINMASPRSNTTSCASCEAQAWGGFRHWTSPERMIEQAPGITRLLDRLEGKKLVRRERPSDNRRQVLCYITKPGLDLLQELDTPVGNR